LETKRSGIYPPANGDTPGRTAEQYAPPKKSDDPYLFDKELLNQLTTNSELQGFLGVGSTARITTLIELQ
jgi:hypothetical protein